jgi:phosphatidylserine/phosphatidylglycerophosphate/cardiolipin synthase-like enzyme
MNDFQVHDSVNSFTMKLWRGERMCLIGFDVDPEPGPDFVGFAIEVKAPDESDFSPLANRLAFSYEATDKNPVSGAKKYPSTDAPFQTYRWIHFPNDPKPGLYTYKGTKMHMRADGTLEMRECVELSISLDPVTYSDFLDVGFTRNFASSQAYRERYENCAGVIPSDADGGLDFSKLTDEKYKDIYQWMGFEAYDLIFAFLDEAVRDESITLDVFAYDLNEPDIVEKLEQMGKRLRVIIDDSTDKVKDSKGKAKLDEHGNIIFKGHGTLDSTESRAAERLRVSAGKDSVKRTHFKNLQHHKVFIARKNGDYYKVLTGSTNFSFRGIYIQANNVLIFRSSEIAGRYGEVFEAAFQNPSRFSSSDYAKDWFTYPGDPANGLPAVHVCFSPHVKATVSLDPVVKAIEGAKSSVLYSVAFLNQIKSQPGSTRAAFDGLAERDVFSYGVVNSRTGLKVFKPDHSTGVVDFEYLSKNSPYPFGEEWAAGQGINIHHKFVVTDFNIPGLARVFTGSSNLAASGEKGNGDNLIMIEDAKVATVYAIEALRMFDHLHFRTIMKEADVKKKAARDIQKAAPPPMTLQKPPANGGKPVLWFEKFYVPGSQREKDRKLFSGTLRLPQE